MDKKKSLLLLTAAAAGTVIYNIWKPVRSNLPVIKNLELDKYLGEWYEVARLDFFWEKGLKNVKANYSLEEDDTLKVVNSGVRIKDNKTKKSIGKAKFQGNRHEGALKVSFFGPFYSGYNIMHIAGDYEYALVFGENLDYMWILSRTKSISLEYKTKYLAYAKSAGYDIDAIVWTIQE